MATKLTKEQKEAFAQWKEHCRVVQALTAASLSVVKESPVEKERRIKRLLSNYDEFCEYYFAHFLTLRDKTTGEVIRMIHNAPFHTKAALKIKNTPNLKAVFKWPRGHAKSTHIGVFIPLWLIFQPKRLINFMITVGKSQESANRLLGDLQAELEYNQKLIADFGEQKNLGLWLQGEFKTKGGAKFLAVGRGQSPRGSATARRARTIS